jgi:hypothetical protein
VDTKKFQRKIENFTCKKCDLGVSGDGYRNHCPKCLWSRHVDVNPGDRDESCGGLMCPIGVEVQNGEKIVLHKCERCGQKKRNKAAKDDDFNELLRLSGLSVGGR